MDWIAFVPVPFVAGAWLFAVVNWILAIRHRVPEQSLASHIFQGMKAFDPDNFTPEGQKYQRRFLIGFAVFFACAALSVLLGVLLGSAR